MVDRRKVEQLRRANRQLQARIVELERLLRHRPQGEVGSVNTREREAHRKQLLLAIRKVNQLAISATDPQYLIDEASTSLTCSLGYGSAWIVLFDSSGKNIAMSAHSGFTEGFDAVLADLGDGRLPLCMVKSSNEQDHILIFQPENQCPGCALAKEHEGYSVLGRYLVVAERTYGFIAVAVPRPSAEDIEEHGLLHEIADHLSFALHKIEATQALQRTRQSIDTSNDSILWFDDDGNIIDANTAACRNLAYSRDELLTRNAADIDPQFSATFWQQCRRHLAENSVMVFESQHCTSSGKVFPIELALHWLEFAKRGFYCGIARDISASKKAESALRNSATFLESIFRAAPVGIGVVVDRVFQQVNELMCQMTGYSQDELIGRSARMLYQDEASYQWVGQEKYRQIMAHGTGTVETLWLRKDGTAFDVLLSSTPLDPADLSKGVTFSALDITDRKKAEMNLSNRESYFRALFENAGDAIMIADNQDHILDVNHRACQLLGYTRAEMLQLSVPDLQAPDHRGRKGSVIRDELQLCNGVPFETVDIRKDGVLVPVEVTTVRLTEMENGLALSIVRDISERKQAEVDRDRLIQAIEQSGETILITDPGGLIQYVNPAFERTTGYLAVEVIGKKTSILRSGKHEDALYRQLWETVAGGKTWKGILINKKKDGSLFTEEATISPVIDPAGRVVNYVAVKLDISQKLEVEREKTLLEMQYFQAQKMEAVGRLAGGVAHDFNNMLGVIQGYAEIALAKEQQGEPVGGDLEVIFTTAQKSAEIVRQLMAFARQQTIAPKVIDLNSTVAGMLKMLRRMIGEDITLLWLPASGLWPIKMDPAQIDQILANLCVNARDAISDVGKITISTSMVSLDADFCAAHAGCLPGNFVVLAVSDDGCGIDEHIQRHIFEPFFTTKAVGRGTGLGLATVHGIVKQNEGFIEVTSTPGAGTTLKIYLPSCEAEEDREQVAATTARLASKGETVLLVEDDSTILQMAQIILERLGYRVLPMASPLAAIQLVKHLTIKVDLLLTDVVMPEMNGRELARLLLENCPGLKVLFMSGYTANVIAHHGVLDEGIHFIQKPFSVDSLAAKVREALESDAPVPHQQ